MRGLRKRRGGGRGEEEEEEEFDAVHAAEAAKDEG